MWRAEHRRVRDRRFLPFQWEKHWKRAYSVVKMCAISWDLFPPISGYRPFSNAKGTYNVSPQRQHRDWSNLVIRSAGYKCLACGADSGLEAHHLWPQSWFPQLRYVPRNGMALCRPCNEKAPWKREVTPQQLQWLTQDVTEVNWIIDRSDFWDHYTAGLEKGRLLAVGIEVTEIDFTCSKVRTEIEWYKQMSKLNDFRGMFLDAAQSEPFPEPSFRLNEDFWNTLPQQ